MQDMLKKEPASIPRRLSFFVIAFSESESIASLTVFKITTLLNSVISARL